MVTHEPGSTIEFHEAQAKSHPGRTAAGAESRLPGDACDRADHLGELVAAGCRGCLVDRPRERSPPQPWQQRTPEARAEAGRLHQEILPLIVFMTRHLQTHQLAVGKRFLARRLGLEEVHVRSPAATPTAFQLEEIARIGGWLGPLGGGDGLLGSPS